jgi:outer membrane protein OmpA-like peptidoglycan-associated protein
MLSVVSAGRAQSITFNDERISVGQAVEAIRKQAGYSVSYNKNLLDPSRHIPVTKEGMKLTALLDALVADLNAEYIIGENTVAFVSAEPQQTDAVEAVEVEAPVVETYLVPEVLATERRPEPQEDTAKIEVIQLLPPPVVEEPVEEEPAPVADTLPAMQWALKTNILSALTATLNLGAEMRVADRITVQLPVSYNVWEFKNYRKWKHIAVQPGVRLWAREAYRGHFFGAQLHYAYYNICNLPAPFAPYMHTHRFEGWLAGVGVSYGYRWNFDERWALEAELGLGYARLKYDKFECVTCNDYIGTEGKHYLGPTKATVNLVMMLGKPQREVPVVAQPVEMPPVVVPDTVVMESPQPAVEISFTPRFIVPEAQPGNNRTESGKAYLDFSQGSAEILPEFKNNAAELAKMRGMLDGIRSERDAQITGVTMVGYASPEGSSTSNKSLSERRANALKSYFQISTELPAALLDASGEGEDWDGLNRLIAESNNAYRDRALDIINTQSNLDLRERQLISLGGGEFWRRMTTEMFPVLRRVDYRVAYKVAPFTLERGIQTMKSRPQSLSLDEMYLVAQSYAPESTQYYDAFMEAVRIYPESDVANVNAAAVALLNKETDKAADYLGKAKERGLAWWNNMGIVFFLRGDMERAMTSFVNAEAQGEENVRKLKEHLN